MTNHGKHRLKPSVCAYSRNSARTSANCPRLLAQEIPMLSVFTVVLTSFDPGRYRRHCLDCRREAARYACGRGTVAAGTPSKRARRGRRHRPAARWAELVEPQRGRYPQSLSEPSAIAVTLPPTPLPPPPPSHLTP